MPPRRFIYRLEKVLEIKRKKEEEEKEKLARLLADEAREREVKARLEARLAQVRAELRIKQQQATLDIEELRWYPQHIKHLENQITNQELRLRELAILITAQRQALTRAVQERQLYEKHKEKSHEAWTAEQDAEEAKQIDELATIKHAREQVEGAGDVHL